MLVEMLLLVIIAIAVFGFVLAPIVLPKRRDESTVEITEPDAGIEPEPVSAESRPARETS